MSAWGKSWGLAFGVAWGLVATPVPVQEQATYYGGDHKSVHEKYEAIRKAQDLKRLERPQAETFDQIIDKQLAKEAEQAERKRLIAETKATEKAKAKALSEERARAKAQERQLAADLKQSLAAEAKEAARLDRDAKAAAKIAAKAAAQLAQDQLGQAVAAQQEAFKQERIAKARQVAADKAQALADAKAREVARLAAVPKPPSIELPTGAAAQSKRDQAADEEQIMALMALMMLEG